MRALRILGQGHSTQQIGAMLGLIPNRVGVWATLSGMTFSIGRRSELRKLNPLEEFPTTGHGCRLSQVDRARIQVGPEEGLSIRRITQTIVAAPSTVSREIQRAQLSTRSHTRYDAQIAHSRAAEHGARPKHSQRHHSPMYPAGFPGDSTQKISTRSSVLATPTKNVSSCSNEGASPR